jgi:hypothetical protein
MRQVQGHAEWCQQGGREERSVGKDDELGG